MTLPDIDLHLLRCLEVLIAERHVTRAADKLGMSQSGMSTALAKLRGVFDDPILVRTPHGMQLSEHAPEIAGSVRRALAELELALGRRGPFDPAGSSMTFTVMASDYFGLTILPRLVEKLCAEAPGISLTIVAPQPKRIREALANSEVDLVVGFFHDLSDGLYQTIVMREPLVCVARAGHPLIDGSVSAAGYSAASHVYYGSPPTFISSIEVMLERVLPPLGIERRSNVHVSALSLIPGVIARTELVGTMPGRVPRGMLQSLALQVLSLPFELPDLPVHAIWHERMQDNPAHRWLRAMIQEIGKGL